MLQTVMFSQTFGEGDGETARHYFTVSFTRTREHPQIVFPDQLSVPSSMIQWRMISGEDVIDFES